MLHLYWDWIFSCDDYPCRGPFQLSYFLSNPAKYYKVNFPADSDGTLCGIDKPAYPYVYFVNPPEMVTYH